MKRATQQDQLATKHDLELLSGVVKADLRDLHNHLKVDMAELKTELVRWVFLCILGQSAMLLGVGYFFLNHIVT